MDTVRCNIFHAFHGKQAVSGCLENGCTGVVLLLGGSAACGGVPYGVLLVEGGSYTEVSPVTVRREGGDYIVAGLHFYRAAGCGGVDVLPLQSGGCPCGLPADAVLAGDGDAFGYAEVGAWLVHGQAHLGGAYEG